MNADTILVFALGLLVGYAFAVYHGKSKRAVAYVQAESAPVAEDTQPTCPLTRKQKQNLPAIPNYVTEGEHKKALALAEKTHAAELASAVEVAREALYVEATKGVYDAYRLGMELAKHDVAFEPDAHGIRLTKVMGGNRVLECIVAIDGNVHYVRGDKADLARLLNNKQARKSLSDGRSSSRSNNNQNDFIPGLDDVSAPSYEDYEYR